jgi:hypothetical protein
MFHKRYESKQDIQREYQLDGLYFFINNCEKLHKLTNQMEVLRWQ